MFSYDRKSCGEDDAMTCQDHLRLMKKQTEDALEEMTSSGPEADDQRAALGQEMESVHEGDSPDRIRRHRDETKLTSLFITD